MVEAGWSKWPVRSESETCSVVKAPAKAGKRGSRACVDLAKATEGTREPGAGAEEPSGVGGVERSEGCRGNWRGPTRPGGCVVVSPESARLITGVSAGKWRGAGGASEAAVVPLEPIGTTEPAVREGPLLRLRVTYREGLVSAIHG